MANDYFQFQQFTIYQDRCAMKVGTDGTLLGTWASGGTSVLDIGTGTGILALMMAQRFTSARITAIDIDSDAVAQAMSNVAASPFAGRVDVIEADVSTFQHSPFAAIVCNPPYFVDALECPDQQRTIARHSVTLSYRVLMTAVKRLLADDGEFSVIIPFDCKARIESEASLAGLFKIRECAIKTTPKKQPKRYLMAFRKHPSEVVLTEGVLETSPNHRSEWYHELSKDFYL